MIHLMVILKRALVFFFCLGASLGYAAIPKFSIIPIGALPPSVIFITNTATANYTVTNNTYITRTLTMVPMQGVTQVGGTCTAPAFTLAHGQSCILSLLITANQLSSSGIACRTEGDITLCNPEICKIIGPGNTNPDPFLCSQPSSANSLKITPTTIGALTSDVDALALAVTSLGGTPRIIRVTNNSASVVTNITATPSALPPGTTITLTPLNCEVIAPGGVCTITISPGDSTTNSPFNLAVRGDGTNTLNFTIDILKYGSNYQSGLVFAIDNSPPNNKSVSGKIVSDVDQAPINTITWDNSLDESIWGIADTSTTLSPQPNQTSPDPAILYPGQLNCNGKIDGKCDTNNIVVFYGMPFTSYSAGLCKANIGGYNDWYLPSICEMGYDNGFPSLCGDSTTPLLPNIQSNIVDPLGAPMGAYWSSTEVSFSTLIRAWSHDFSTLTNSASDKDDLKGVRCVRIFNPYP